MLGHIPQLKIRYVLTVTLDGTPTLGPQYVLCVLLESSEILHASLDAMIVLLESIPVMKALQCVQNVQREDMEHLRIKLKIFRVYLVLLVDILPWLL